MKAIHSILTAGIALAMLTTSALALTLPVSEDSSTSGNAAVAKSAGGENTLRVSASRQGLLRFEAGAFADSLSAGDVSKARLVFYITSVTAPGALTLHRVTQDWSEDSASSPAFDAAPLATIPAASVIAKQFVVIDVTAAVQAWLSAPGTDFGFAIVGSDGARVLLGSKEGAATGHPAQLQIETDAAFLDEENAAEGGRTRASATGPIGNFVTNADVVNNSLTGKKIKDATLLGKKLALETVTGANILNASIKTEDLADAIITTGELADASVSTAKLIDASVTAAKLAANSVNPAKLDATIGLWTVAGDDVVRATGRVGIGITPTKAKVEISGRAGSYLNIPPAGFLNALTPVGTTPGGFDLDNFSLYASEEIGAKVYFAFSDERIKRIEGRSDATRDLATLLSVQVTDYTYIDTLCKGAGKQKKLIAQQVEKVYPQAVRRTTDVVPDIFQKAEVQDGWVKLATDLKKGERVRLIGEKKEGIHEVLEVAEDKFRTDFAADGHEVFVYGREVKDFRNVDYEAIAMLNVSATQELHRKIEAKDAEVAVLKKQLAAHEAREQAREARLARLESALDAGPARAVRASLDLK